MRIQLELSETQMRDLKTLMKETDIETYKELFNNSLTLFQWAADEIKAGNEIASVNEEREKYKVLIMPALERVAKQVQEQAQLVGVGPVAKSKPRTAEV